MNATQQRPHKGRGMEGWIARWYTRTRRRDMEDFRRQAQSAAERLRSDCQVLEVAPGPGFFSIELARLGNFRITGLDISRTFVDIAAANARKAVVDVDFRLGNASAMPFTDGSFDFVYCSAAFKNFSEPIKALDEMYRVLRPGGEALVVDLRKDAPLDEISFYMRKSGRSRIDAWATMWVFRHMLIKRAYRKGNFVHMAEASRFGGCQINPSPIGFEVRFCKPPAPLPPFADPAPCGSSS
ncbi:MAG TPA: methyltransferase domain-containing protein [Candidatus Cybelea sp.]|nr:methyltransferase domain-containing protein [Candidatus Cybelea sp.]